MSELNALPSLKQVRDILKRSGACSRLNDHPLTRTRLFQNYVADHPERSSSPPGEILLWLLFDIWREDMYPEKLWPELAEEWRSYVTLGVIYFLPLLKGKKPTAPQKLKAACVQLRRREELSDGGSPAIKETRQDFRGSVAAPPEERSGLYHPPRAAHR